MRKKNVGDGSSQDSKSPTGKTATEMVLAEAADGAVRRVLKDRYLHDADRLFALAEHAGYDLVALYDIVEQVATMERAAFLRRLKDHELASIVNYDTDKTVATAALVEAERRLWPARWYENKNVLELRGN